MKKIDFTKFDSLLSVAEYFNSEMVCKQALAEARWGDDVVCPYCGKHHCTKMKNGRYCCTKCKHNFSVTVGTIFANTKITLRQWFLVMYLISSHKRGISSYQIARDINVCQKTAWFILHKIRIMFNQSDEKALFNVVECDETYLGGTEKNKHESKKTESARFEYMFSKALTQCDYKAVVAA